MIARGNSLFGPKPDRCPASFKTCGDCNIYPCLIGAPVVYAPAVQEVEIVPIYKVLEDRFGNKKVVMLSVDVVPVSTA